MPDQLEEQQPKPVQMTQEALDALISDRLRRQEATLTAKFADYDTVKTELATLKTASETDAEKRVREAVEAAKTEVEQTVTAKHSAAIEAARTRVLESAIKSEAQALGFAHIEDVIERLRNSKEIELTDEFEVKGVDKAVKKLADERPSWLKAETGGSFTPRRPADQGPDGDQIDGDERRISERKRLLGNMGYMTKL